MKTITKLTCIFAVLFAMTWLTVSQGQTTDQRPTTIVTVGLITYDDYKRTYVDGQQTLTTLAAAYNKNRENPNKVSFQLTVGSYDDVLDWYKKGQINVAILSPGPVAVLLASPEWKSRLADLYIGTTVATPAGPANHLANAQRHRKEDQVSYHSVCVVSGDRIRTLPELKKKVAEDKVSFLFVHPLSASGRILPEYVLKQIFGEEDHFKAALNDARYTYSHKASLLTLQQPTTDGKINVAFVMDQSGDEPAAGNVHKIDIPELDRIAIPQEIVLISSKFKEKQEFVRDVFLSRKKPTAGTEGSPKYKALPNWLNDYTRKNGVVNWFNELDHKPDLSGKIKFGLKEILDKVRSYENSHPGEARTRLALVLSGGGAKCAYQAGVIEAVEDAIIESNETARKNTATTVKPPAASNRAVRESLPSPTPRPLDIDLVVGTSGGAINALAVATGVTKQTVDPVTQKLEQPQTLAETWKDFKQQDFFQPWSPMPVTLGLMVGAAQTLILILGLRLVDDERIKWRKATRPVVICLAMLALVLALGPWKFWGSLIGIVMLIVIGVQLYENQAEDWRALTGLCLVVLGLIELVIATFSISPITYARYAIPALLFIGLVFALVLATRVLTLDGTRWRLCARVVIPIVIAVDILIVWIWPTPINLLMRISKNHLTLHLWMALSMNLVLSALFLFLVGASMLAAEWSIRRAKSHEGLPQIFSLQGETRLKQALRHLRRYLLALLNDNTRFFARRKPILDALTIGLILLLTLQLVRTFLLDKSLSRSEGVDHAFVEKLPHLLLHQKGGLTQPPGATDRQRLENLSLQILDRQLVSRDMIITNTSLNDPDQPDLYFYYQSPTTGIPPPTPQDNDERFRSFQKPEVAPRLLDIIIGSTTIYPVFDPRNVALSKNESIAIIDGGFAHNSPIEAAVSWGAKFIILIEASPLPSPSLHRNLLDNSFDAFNFLFKGAQLTDVHSRGKVEIFQIQPESEAEGSDANLCTFDFDPDLMEGAISKGRTDALLPKFLRTRGLPIF